MRRAGYKGELISDSLAHIWSQSRPDEVPKLSHDDVLDVNDDVVYVNDNANVDVLNGNDNGNFDYNDAD